MNYNHRCPKGNRQRRVLNQVTNAAVKAKTIFAIAYRRLVPCLGHAQAIGAIVQLCRLILKISRTFVLGFRLDPQAPRAIAKITEAIGERCGGETSSYQIIEALPGCSRTCSVKAHARAAS